MSFREIEPTILDSPISASEREEFPAYQDLAPLMSDFSLSLRGISQKLNFPEEEMAWQLREVPLKGYSCFFITLSSREILSETEIDADYKEHPQISLFRITPDKEFIKSTSLGYLEEKGYALGASTYTLRRGVSVPFITAQGEIHHYSRDHYLPHEFPCLVQTNSGPVFQVVISRTEITIGDTKQETLPVYSPDLGLSSQIWSHLKSKPGFLESFQR